MIVAEGHPVVITSPARRAEARGDRVQIICAIVASRSTAAATPHWLTGRM